MTWIKAAKRLELKVSSPSPREAGRGWGEGRTARVADPLYLSDSPSGL